MELDGKAWPREAEEVAQGHAESATSGTTMGVTVTGWMLLPQDVNTTADHYL